MFRTAENHDSDIDSLARNGMIMTNHYSGSTVSAPSRCVLLTGKHTGHCYIRGNRGIDYPDGSKFDEPLADGETTIAEILKEEDYETACIGKWGLGGPQSEGHPNNQGFDYFSVRVMPTDIILNIYGRTERKSISIKKSILTI